jgi:subtilisin family serine protease
MFRLEDFPALHFEATRRRGEGHRILAPSHQRLLVLKQRIALALALLCCLLPPQVAQPRAVASGRLIVVFKPASGSRPAEQSAALAQQYRARGLLRLEALGIDGRQPGARAYLGVASAGADLTTLAASLARSPLVQSVEPNVPRRFLAIDPDTGPLDEQFVNQPYYFTIGVVAMWARGLTGISATNPITVAVLDTGVDLAHPDIDGNLAPGYDIVSMGAAPPQDGSSDSHGSMVAGVIGAEINNDIVGGVARGVAGIGGGDALAGTPGLRIMPVRVAVNSSDELDCAQAAQALDYARAHGARVINMSYGGAEPCDLELAAVQRAYDAGILLVAGAGNDGDMQPIYPAAYGAGTNERLVIAVAGLAPSGAKADASNYGPWVDIAAPFRVFSITNTGGHAAASGTSFSAPFVSGLLGVLMSNYGWSRDQATWKLLTTADNVDAENPGYEGQLGAGRINAGRASALIHDVSVPLVRR